MRDQVNHVHCQSHFSYPEISDWRNENQHKTQMFSRTTGFCGCPVHFGCCSNPPKTFTNSQTPINPHWGSKVGNIEYRIWLTNAEVICIWTLIQCSQIHVEMKVLAPNVYVIFIGLCWFSGKQEGYICTVSEIPNHESEQKKRLIENGLTTCMVSILVRPFNL